MEVVRVLHTMELTPRMTPRLCRAQEDLMSTKKTSTDQKALDRLARGITPEKLRPMTAEQSRRWQAAKRAKPRKATAVSKAVPTLISIESGPLRRYAKRAGVSRSKLFSEAVRERMGGSERA